MPALASIFRVSTALLLAASGVASAALPGPVIAQYWPAYNTAIQPPASFPWGYSSFALYFVTVTTATGFEIPAGQSLSDLQQFVKLAKQNNVKPTFSVGGWDGGLHFSDLVGSASGRTKLATQLKAFADKYGFQGVDIDWDYPNSQGIGCNSINPNDSANLLSFLQVLRSKFGSSGLLTAAVSTTGFVGPDGKALADFSSYGKYLDYLNLMTYDISGPWSAKTGPLSPLATCAAESGGIMAAVALWTAGGFPASKILVGIPAYGVSWTTKSSTLATTTTNGQQSQLYQAHTAVTPKGDANDVNSTGNDVCGNPATGYSGQWSYKTLISGGILSSDGKTGLKGFKRIYDACTSTVILFNPKSRLFINYEDSVSVQAKTAWVKSQGLAGVMVFDSTGFDSSVYTTVRQTLGWTAPHARRL